MVGNALKHANNSVQITLLAQANNIVFIVEMMAMVLLKVERENVFKPFTRLDKSRDKKTGGFGLGLAIVSKIISWHQGQCTIEDSSLGGAKFIVSLPINK